MINIKKNYQLMIWFHFNKTGVVPFRFANFSYVISVFISRFIGLYFTKNVI